MSWERIIERLYMKGKLTKERVSKAQTKGLINKKQKDLICNSKEKDVVDERSKET